MADPEARVVITGKDATAAAFASADKNLKHFQRTARDVRQLLGSFGVVFSARAFLGWINGALEAAEATGEHEEAVKSAKATLEAMKGASDALALSIGTSLVPAMEALTAVFTGWNRLISGADPFPFEAQIEKLRNQLHGMDVQLQASQGMPFEWRMNFVEQIAAVENELDALLKKQREALGLEGPIKKPTQLITDAEVQAINDLIAEINTPKPRQPLITQDELVALESFIYELNQREPFITTEETIALEEFLNELNTAQEMLTQEEWVDLESFIYDLNHMETEAEKAAINIGADFKRAFADWLYDGEFEFKEFLKRLSIELGTSALFQSLGGLFAGKTGGVAGFFSDFFGGARANGGPVSPGKAYLVGEKGPEWFTPGSSGKIVPQTSAPVYVTNNLHFDVGLESVDERIRGAAAPISQATTAAVLKALNRPAIA